MSVHVDAERQHAHPSLEHGDVAHGELGPLGDGLLGQLALLPDGAEAQRRGRYNEFSFSPYVGAYKDAYDVGGDDSDLGFLAAVRDWLT